MMCNHKAVLDLEAENSQIKAENAALNAKMSKMEEIVKDMAARLVFYENSNSPPSQNSLAWKEEEEKRREARKERRKSGKGSKRGGKPGHTGRTQIFSNPTKSVDHAASQCRHCSSPKIKVTNTFRKNVVEVPEMPRYCVVEHVTHRYACADCGKTTESESGTPPGSFGHSVLDAAASAATEFRMPLEMVTTFLKRSYGLDVTPPTAMNILDRAADKLEPAHDEIRSEILESDMAGMDETSVPVEGEPWWIWAMRTLSSVLYSIHPSRGAKAIRDFVRYAGVLVVDGHRPYFTTFLDNDKQRCTAHLERDAEGLARKASGGKLPSHSGGSGSDQRPAEGGSVRKEVGLYHQLAGLLHEARIWAKEEHDSRERAEMAELLEEITRRIIKRYRDSGGSMEKFGNKLNTALPYLFTFVRIPGVPSTNNWTEQSIRMAVLWRKIHGQLKNAKGARRLSILLTCFETWKMRGLNPMIEMAKWA